MFESNSLEIIPNTVTSKLAFEISLQLLCDCNYLYDRIIWFCLMKMFGHLYQRLFTIKFIEAKYHGICYIVNLPILSFAVLTKFSALIKA